MALIVRGLVRHADGRVVVGATVRAFDRDLRREEGLGEAVPDAGGRYEIAYDRDRLARAEKENADLVVRVTGRDGRELAVSAVLFNAPEEAEVDVTVPPGTWDLPSLFETVGLALEPLLGDVRPAELDEDAEYQDVSFLAGETGFVAGVLARYALAHRMPADGLPPEFWFAVLGGGAVPVPAEGLRDQLPALLAALSGLDAATVRKALTGAFNLDEIAAHLQDQVPAWLAAFRNWTASAALADGDGRGPSFAKAALTAVGVDDEGRQQQFAALLAEHGAITPDMVRRLRRAGFSGKETTDLQTSFALAELTKGDFSTVRVIRAGFEVTTPDRVSAPARAAEAEWVKLVTDRHAAGELTVPLPTGPVAERAGFPAAELYGRALARRFRDEFPTAAFAGDLGRAIGAGDPPALDHAPRLSRLLDQRPQFDLLTTPVDEFLDRPDGDDLEGDDPGFRLELKAVQRLFKLVPGFDATTTLLADRIRSAQQVYAIGQAEFVERYAARPGFTADTARIAWNRAADTHAAVLTIIGELTAFDRGVPKALGGSSPALSAFPNWNNLFQTGDFCECDTCRSVLGPAAYLADLLRFLRDRPGTTVTAKEVLFRRRPDLGWLELNCANGSVPLPYIDVVNEVLEEVVAPGATDQELAGLTAIPANPVQAKREVLDALAAARLDPGDAYLTQVRSAIDQWVVHGEKATYLLRKKGAPNFFARLLPNTKATAEEVRAYPQYVNAEAYRTLRQATYPAALPFDLFAEEVRAAFRKSNLQRWEVMQAFGAAEGDAATEYFGISSDPAAAVDEKRLILVADPTVARQQALWGETGPAWLDAVGNVANFLRKTGLEYNDMLALLDLPWINPKGDIAVEYLQPSCDVAQQRLRVLDAAKLDRIHRFLRLWRKLPGWQLWELELALTASVVGKESLDERFLVNLFRLDRARRRLGKAATVERVLALFGDLNTRTRFTEPFEPRADALYQTLFLDRRLIQPLDPAFQVPLAPGAKLADHLPVVIAALGISETDLAVYQSWFPADAVNPASLAFLWRHSWLAKTLKRTAEQWRDLVRLVHPGLVRLAGPAALLHLLDAIDAVDAAGFSVDELHWLLAADRSAKAATKESDAATFLRGLRKQLQTVRDTYDPGPLPTAVGELDAMLTRLLAELGRGDAEARGFVRTLRGPVILESGAGGLPATFVFPAAVAIPVRHDAAAKVLRLTGVLSDVQSTALLDDAGPALAALRAANLAQAPAQLPAGFAFPAGLGVLVEYDEANELLRFTGLMTDAQRSVLLTDPALAAVTGDDGYVAAVQALHQQSVGVLAAYRGAVTDLRDQSVAAPTVYVTTQVQGPAGSSLTLPAALPCLPVSYDAQSGAFAFAGLMTAAEQAALKAAGNPAAVVDELFQRPRLAVKFFEPVFTAPLEALPTGVDFGTLLPPDLAARIGYDEEERFLRLTGIPTAGEVALLRGLSAVPAYRAALDSLVAQPATVVPPDRRVWVTEPDLDPATPLAQRLGDATLKALRYLRDSQAAGAAVDAASAQLGLIPAVTRHLATQYPPALLDHLTGALAASTGVVDHATLPDVFDAWYWAARVAAIWRKGGLTLTELRRIDGLTPAAKLLDVGALPLTAAAGPASLDEFRRLATLLRLRRTLPEPGMTLLDLLRKLAAGEYTAETGVTGMPAGFTFPPELPVRYDEPTGMLRLTGVMSSDQRQILLSDPGLSAVTGIVGYQRAIERLYRAAVHAFAADVRLVTGDWAVADVTALILRLDLRWPTDYLLPESWERLAKALALADGLGAGADTLAAFAAPAVGPAEARTVKELLRSKLGTETWLSLCAEIQDDLRERRRDALAAYLLTRPRPADAPTGTWENTNDLYAYYVLDVDMGACQLTSRIVQASGSVQLFVQRCFMGLEPAVPVQEDGDSGDSAWRWWSWMRKYRVWEANRKIFLWPENWIEPELRVDSSPFFRDLQNELIQSEITQAGAETAVGHYLEKLDGVAHLEVAGFYQEDDGAETVVHVFARTPGGEPHVYYYRRFDYRQWTPWERVDLEIQGDYLVPAVVGRRLFLFWPVFKEVPDESSNSKVKVPTTGTTTFTPDKTNKILQMQMAMSEYRGGQWTPKRVSTGYAASQPYTIEIVNHYYRFSAVDRTESEGRFFISYEGNSRGKTPGTAAAYLKGEAEMAGCGVPDFTFTPLVYTQAPLLPMTKPDPLSTGLDPVDLRWQELPARQDAPDDDLTLLSTPLQFGSPAGARLLGQTPGLFQLTPGRHQSYLNRLTEKTGTWYRYSPIIVDGWLPFFYRDGERNFFVLPSSRRGAPPDQPKVHFYYPMVKAELQSWERLFGQQIETWLEGFVLGLTPDERSELANWLVGQLNLPTTPVTDAELKDAVRQDPRQAVYFWLVGLADQFIAAPGFHFRAFYHPLVCEFGRILNDPARGVPALMSRATQLSETEFRFADTYQPGSAVLMPTDASFHPREDVDFSPAGAYASYNWELFFHVPLLIADTLSRNQRFEEARDWYHRIFDPLGVAPPKAGGSPMSKYWVTRPFYETTDAQYLQQRVDSLLRLLAGDPNAPGYPDLIGDVIQAVSDWRTHPFEPHRIAAYRTVAYQKAVVLKYVRNLIEWGDQLFRQDSMESINEATQLYVMAAEILGPKPRTVPPQARPVDQTYNELEQEFDDLANYLVQVENLIPRMPGTGGSGGGRPPLPLLYFCIPTNEKMLEHWDLVADRLYKIRHCLDIEGVARQLSLFEPPIDPAALVKAVAGGVDLSAALLDLDAPLPLYRFTVLLQKANEVCGDVKALGAALLGALEKKDAETLGLLRQTQEIRMLEGVKALREQQIEEAKENLEGIRRSKAVTEVRRDYYRDIVRLNAQEQLHLDKMAEAHLEAEIAQGVMLGASIISYLPAIDLGASGFGGSPIAKFKIGGLELGQAASLASDVLRFLSEIASNDAAMASAKGGFDRRWDEWKLQETLAGKELDQLDTQIAAAEIRVGLAEKELANHVRQIDDAKATDAFMRGKYTNEDLYQWQTGQISAVYLQSYKLAYDLARRAERCYRFELGIADSSYVSFGYWDSLKKGLMAGERLQYDLRRLESAYLEQNRREFELTKHVSLAMLDPLALVQLRETGRCFFTMPEELFDLDFPGHYFRRIKSVSVSLPSVVGPYTTVSCTLRLLGNSLRTSTATGDGYARAVDGQGLPADDGRFVESNIPVRAVAVSGAQNDSGVFELSFRDERYLPFEGAGAISRWALELFNDPPDNNPDPAAPDHGRALRQFDYRTITDAVVHVRYTAREDAGLFKNKAVTHLRESLADSRPSLRLLDLRQDFPTSWHRFLHPATETDGNVFDLELRPDLFPWRDAGKTLKLTTLWVLARCTDPGGHMVTLSPTGAEKLVLTRLNQYGGLHVARKDVSALGLTVSSTDSPAVWKLRMTVPTGKNLPPAAIDDLMLVLQYTWDT